MVSIEVGRYARKCSGSWSLPRQTLVSTLRGIAGGLRRQFLQATLRCEILNFLYFVISSLIPFLALSFSSSPSPRSHLSPATFLALYYIDNFHPVRTIISSSRINCLLKYSKPLALRNPRLRTNFWYQRDPRTICIFPRHDPPVVQAGSNLCVLLVNVISFLTSRATLGKSRR